MLYLYPANRMEDLLLLFAKVQQISPLPVMTEELVLVQNQGMQHWLNMQQAHAHRISMNTRFSLPAQFFWQTLRTLCSEQLPEQSPYSRDVLTWRIESILQDEAIIDDSRCDSLTHYWQAATGQQQDLRRYQLARKIADIYEQYLIYRPQWIHAWSQGQSIQLDSSSAEGIAQWQAVIWQRLHQQSPYDPQHLIKQAINSLDSKASILPQRISLFGLNAIAPIWMEFLAAIGKHIDVHFYQLNPCIEYWGDIKSEKSQARQEFQQLLSGWPDVEELSTQVNPLLANLGQQGKDLLSQLQQFDHIEIPVYERLGESERKGSSVLSQLQDDILTLQDRRIDEGTNHQPQFDDSIVICSAHSALREVQGLHDYLLHQFNQDPQLTPKDVLVMCPQVEDYAPYIDAVFVRGWEDIGENIPPLPCSIADRVSKDSEPLVNGFNELLNLPDSRFEVSKLISYLQLKPVQKRFKFNDADIELISFWVQQACIHWGLDAHHKGVHIGSDEVSAQFTWKLGLQRLLRGFAYSDQFSVSEHDLYLPWVEGDNSVLLGKFILFLEQLQALQRELDRPRAAEDWHQLLMDWLARLFEEDEQDQDNGLIIVRQAIDSLYEHCQQAKHQGEIKLWPVREYLNTHFSEPDPGRQFMIGQITFCSMLPMRSIPFKLVAILGLNDGQFPRQRQPIGFDLMSMTPSKLGDRSLHKDDRYLFLEALISARQHLYLSYQGRDIRNNGERQPSIVLRELMDYLAAGFGWQLSGDEHIRQLPMQAFSNENYAVDNLWPSFDKKWLNLSTDPAQIQNVSQVDTIYPHQGELIEQASAVINDADLIELLRHPAKLYGSRVLNLSFAYQQEPLQDTEPFTVNALEKFSFKQQVLGLMLQRADATDPIISQQLDFDINQLQRRHFLSGSFPDRSDTYAQLTEWRAMVEFFASHVQGIQQAIDDNGTAVELPIRITLPAIASILPSATLSTDPSETIATATSQTTGQAKQQQPGQVIAQKTLMQHFVEHQQGFTLMYAKSSSANEGDLCQFYIGHLLACAYAIEKQKTDANATMPKVTTLAMYLNENKKTIEQYQLEFWPDAFEILMDLVGGFLAALKQPFPVSMAIARKNYWSRNKFHPGYLSQASLETLWHEETFGRSLATDPYLQYFFPQCPDLDTLNATLGQTYQVFFERLSVKSNKFSEDELSLTPGTAGANTRNKMDKKDSSNGK
ncbi:exodeoxyribonuclease V subunit gamma [Thalassotalea litorea]|uniref:RecBCD enzyme subunit RecC n=1 Tax=Thalassotalea litorea TaxID=2020715 RepID=A0A5R9IP48_9GAMM|nr:exodeoxyribonuclease V subunit gamma [Thalassotalea litorea]TLU66243.1 exodeoxyribonuclease V subunit gamma [Thalassotalea litorea]